MKTELKLARTLHFDPNMEILTAFFIFLFGAAIGSFLNVVILRTHAGKSFDGRSECPNCKHQLAVLDLIPILSYLLLSGKCRYCKRKLSFQYPLVELLTAVSFTLVFLSQISSLLNPFFLLTFAFLLFVVSVLIVISVYDLRWGIIPDKIIIPASIAAFLYQLVFNLILVQNYKLLIINLALAFGISVFFFLIILVTRGRGMGGGDFKLSIFIGLALGWPLALVAIFLGFLTGALAAVMLILLGKKSFKQTVPFGPFLALGALLTILVGKEILELYLKSMGL